MDFVNGKEKLNIEDINQMKDSLLNDGLNSSFVIDKTTYEIIFQSKKANELVGNQLGSLCHPLLFSHSKWQFSDITWENGQAAILATIMENESNVQPEAAAVMESAALKLSVERREMDSLTQIPNYLRFYSGAEHEFQTNRDKKYAMVIFDIDRFKSINDLYGMVSGDKALQFIGNVLQNIFGSENNYARLHSDLFGFYIKYEKKGDIIKVIEKIRKRIAANNFAFDINTSYGIYLVKDTSVPVNLMCDRAMMASKTIKGDILKFCAFYDEQYREEMLKTDEIERNMNKALENHEFKMYLQPKYRLNDLELCGAEVLARWIHPTKGLISPVDFISLFEKNGFILKLDEYMWEEACKALVAWRDEGRRMIPLSVNISRYHVQNNNLEKVFGKLLKRYDLTPDLLHLEITESMLGDKPEKIDKVLTGLQKMGFSIEVDDFGTGFSSLNMIRNIAIDTIKIDKDFLDSKITSDKGKIVVNHTIDMAKDLKLQVIAEGVETKEHVEFLQNSNCDVAQGFYFAKPMPLEEFNKLSF